MEFIGIDIGGTNTRIAVFKNKKIINNRKFSTKLDFNDQVKEIAKVITNLKIEVAAIGVSAPGPADYHRGLFGPLPNLSAWNGHNLIESLQQATGIKNIKMQNDANLMALAHHHYFKNEGGITQFFTISTGLGAGLIINDQIFEGAWGQAQEVAFAPTAFSKAHGKNLGEGALEYFASGSGIALRTKMDTAQAMALYEKNPEVKAIIDEGIDALANAIAIFVAALNPSLIVFDGAVARHNKWYVQKAWELAKTRSLTSQFTNLRFEFAQMGDDAALWGAYYLSQVNK